MPEGCRRNDRPTARWVSRTRGGRRVTDSTVHDSSIDPARAKSSFHRSSVTRASLHRHRLRDDAGHRIVPSFSPRARVKTYARPVMTHHRVPSVVHPSRARGWKVRQFGTTRARASRGRGERARGEASARAFFCSFAVRSPIGRRSDGNRRARSFVGDRARGRAEPRSRRLSVVRAIGRGTARCGR